MAIYHLSAQVIGRASGRSATGAAAYRAGELGEAIADERTGEVHDYTRKRGVLHAEIMAPKNAKAWVSKRADLWNRVEQSEKRKDAQLCRELNIALPAELTAPQRLDLIRRYIAKNFVSQGMVADVCLHAPGRGDDAKNHHAHVMLTTRVLDGEGFGPKAREWNSVGMLESWRKSWADLANEALADAGHDARIDHRSHEARGIIEIPGQHYGPAVSGILSRSEPSDVAERMDAERATRERAQLEAQLAIARAQAAAALSELQVLAQEALVVARLVQAQEDERERAQRLLVAAQDREREHTKRVAAQRVALAQAHAVYDAAVIVMESAEAVQKVARERVDALQLARNAAVLGQREAAGSLVKSALATFKLPGWLNAIKLYNAAVSVLARAERAVTIARESVARAWQRVLGLDPAARTMQQQVSDALIAKLRPAPVSVSAPAPAPAVVHQHDDDGDGDGDGDDGLGAGSMPPAPAS